MYILAIETTGAHASVACIDGAGNLCEENSTGTFSHLQNLMPMIEALLQKNRIAREALTCIAASEGPGSFTGIRIGVSSARALAQAFDIPTIGVPTLKAFAYHKPNYEGLICPIFDARRNQVYAGAYRWGEDGEIAETVKGGAYELPEFLAALRENAKGEITFFGDGIEAYHVQIEQWQISSSNGDIRIVFEERDNRLQKSSSVAKLALSLYRKGETKPYEELKPVYMRKAEAEQKLEAGLLGIKRSRDG